MKQATLGKVLIIFSVFIGAGAPVFAQSNPNTMKFGVIAPLSGDFAYQGQFIRNGVELAVAELRAKGISIEVTYEDACLPSKSLSAAKRLIQHGIHALVGSYCIIGIVPAAPLFERSKTLVFQTSVVPDVLLKAGDYVLSTNVAITDEAKYIARHSIKELGARRAGIIYFPSDWGNDYAMHFTSEFERLGGKVADRAMAQINQMDFRAELTRMKARGIDLLFLPHISSALGSIVKQAHLLGMSVQTVSTNEAEDPQFFEAAGKTADGMVIASAEGRESEANVRRFRKTYTSAFGGNPPATAANAYDATFIAAEVLNKCSFNRECAKKRAYQTENYQGASGTFSIEADGRTNRDFVVKVSSGLRFVHLDSHSLGMRAKLK